MGMLIIDLRGMFEEPALDSEEMIIKMIETTVEDIENGKEEERIFWGTRNANVVTAIQQCDGQPKETITLLANLAAKLTVLCAKYEIGLKSEVKEKAND